MAVLVETLSSLLFVPPFFKGVAAARSVQRNHKDSIQFRFQPWRIANKRRPPSGDAEIEFHCQDLEPEPNVFLCLADPLPIFEDRFAA